MTDALGAPGQNNPYLQAKVVQVLPPANLAPLHRRRIINPTPTATPTSKTPLGSGTGRIEKLST